MAQQLEFLWTQETAAPKSAVARPVVSARPPVAEPPPAEKRVHETRSAETRVAQDAADRLHAELQAATGLAVQLRFTNNSSTMMSLRFNSAGTVARLRLHRMFLDAPPMVRQALAVWMKRPKSGKSGKVLDDFIRAQQHQVRDRAPRPVAIHTAGEFHDLRVIYDEVNAAHFANAITCAITWGKMPTRRRRRSIRFGSYMPGDEIIRMHPLLDQKFVPDYFVRFIVFHEMLHADLGIEELPSGRRAIHPPEFRRREEAYPDFARAVAWMENSRNLGRLLRRPPGLR